MSKHKDADDVDAPPRKKGRKKAKRKQFPVALLVGAIIGGVALIMVLGAVGIFAIVRFRSPADSAKPPGTESKSPVGALKSADTENKVVTKTHEEIYLAAIESMRKVEAAFLQAKDAATADKAADAVHAETLKLQCLQQQIVALGRASAAEKDRVNRHGPTITAVSKSMGNAISQIPAKVQSGQIPREAAQRLLDKGNEFGRAQVEFGKASLPLLD